MADPDQDFVPDTKDQDFIPDPPKKPLMDKVKSFLLDSWLPEKETGYSDYIYQPTSAIGRAIFPGGVGPMPNLHRIYNDVIRPATSTLGLATMGVGAFENRGAFRSAPPEVIEPKAPTKYLPLPRGKAAPAGKGFVHGAEGVAENRPYIIDIGENKPLCMFFSPGF